jgi:molybdopterin converting factor small subunit
MRIYVDFVGDARLASGVKHAELDVPPGTSFRDVVRLVGGRFPTLINQVLETDGQTLMPANILNVNGKRTVRRCDMGDGVSDGDRITFMSILAGG